MNEVKIGGYGGLPSHRSQVVGVPQDRGLIVSLGREALLVVAAQVNVFTSYPNVGFPFLGTLIKADAVELRGLGEQTLLHPP